MAERVLGIDPGVRYLGYALADDGQIVECGYLSPIQEARVLAQLGVSVCIIEKPQQYGVSKARRRDLTDLTLSAGEIKGLVGCAHTLIPEPREWKGQVPKHIHQARILRAMGEIERVLLPRQKTRAGHVLDACGIVLRHVGRM